LSPSGTGYGFEEEFTDLIELNGYRIVKTTRSGAEVSEMIATRTDEVGHQITYVIFCKKSDAPVDEADVEMAARARERHPGGIFVAVSPSAGFSRSAADLAERQGVRLWGPGEIERLRRNVAEKRCLRQREVVRRSDLPEMGAKRRSKAKFVAILIVLSAAVLYIKFYGLGADPAQKLLIDLVEGSGLRDIDLAEVYRSRAPELREFVRNFSMEILSAPRG